MMTALTSDIPTGADCICKMEEVILLFSDNDKKRSGPCVVVDINRRIIALQIADYTKV